MTEISSSEAALADIKVVDFSKFLPGPYCGWLLANLGAQFVRIENPRELAKQSEVFGLNLLSAAQRKRRRAQDIFARNKRSLLIDLSAPEGKAILTRLIAQADVLLEDYRPGVLDKIGYGYEEMARLNPRLIYCSITLCGQTGPLKDKPGHDPIALALAGALSRIGESAERPQLPGVPVADLLSGSNAAIGILAALLARQSTGHGQHIDIAMTDSAMPLIASSVARSTDVTNLPARGTQRADCGIWQTSDGRYLCTTDMEPRYWAQFCRVIERIDFIPWQLNAERREEIRAVLAQTFARRPLAEWVRILGQAGTQFSPIHEIAEALIEPHNMARGMVFTLPDGSGGSVTQIGSPIKLGGSALPEQFAAPIPGGHTREVLSELGYAEEAIAALVASGVVMESESPPS